MSQSKIPKFITSKIDKEIKESDKSQEEIDKEVEESLKKYPKVLRNKLKIMYEHYKNETI